MTGQKEGGMEGRRAFVSGIEHSENVHPEKELTVEWLWVHAVRVIYQHLYFTLQVIIVQ